MRKLILIITIAFASIVSAQTEPESLAREVAAYRESAARAAAEFLERKLPVAERLKAIEPYALIYDTKQIEQFRRVVLDSEEPPEVRAAALDRIVAHIADDEGVTAIRREWLSNPKTPAVLRREALNVEANLSFTDPTIPEVYYKLLDDPEIDFRIFAFTKLVTHGDARAQQRLIQGLDNPASAPLPAPIAIDILSMAVKKEFYPAVFKVLQNTTDDATRLEAIRSLGTYPEARDQLVKISRDPHEAEPFREAALGALFAGDRDNIATYVQPLLTGEGTPGRLQAVGINMTTLVRQAMSFRVKAKKPDDFDRLVQRLAQSSPDSDVRTVAERYLSSVRPRF
jgi:HEAT repeat protein